MNQPNNVTVKCGACENPIEVTLPRFSTPFNSPTVTCAAAAHEKPVKCAHCGQSFVLAASQVYFDWSLVPITKAEAVALNGSRIIAPSLSLVN